MEIDSASHSVVPSRRGDLAPGITALGTWELTVRQQNMEENHLENRWRNSHVLFSCVFSWHKSPPFRGVADFLLSPQCSWKMTFPFREGAVCRGDLIVSFSFRECISYHKCSLDVLEIGIILHIHPSTSFTVFFCSPFAFIYSTPFVFSGFSGNHLKILSKRKLEKPTKAYRLHSLPNQDSTPNQSCRDIHHL